MRLEIGNDRHEGVTPADIDRLVPDQSPARDVIYALVRGDGAEMEAAGDGEGRYDVFVVEKTGSRSAERAVDGATLRALFVAFGARDERWRTMIAWRRPTRPDGKSGTPNHWSGWLAVVAVVVVTLALPLMFDAVFGGLVRFAGTIRLPSAIDSVPARLFLAFFAFLVIFFAIASIVKAIEMRRARSWASVGGRIVASDEGFDRTVTADRTLPKNVRVARIRYAYKVGGMSYEGTRVSLAENTPEEEVDAILARYPVGKLVQVFHDPRAPGKAVLERDGPEEGLLGGCFMLFGIGLCVLLAAMWGVTRAPDMIAATFPRSTPYLVLVAGVVGALLLLLAVAGKRRSREARRWPRVPARILVSTTVPYKRRGYAPLVEYEYQVGGRTHRSRQVLLDTERGGDKRYAERLAARYPVGATVLAYVDPKNPKVAALETSDALLWLLVGMGLVFLGVAAWATRALG